MRSYYKNGFAKHYVRDHDVLRIEAATNNVKKDYDINKGVENLVPLREKLQASPRATKTSSRISWRPSSTAANYGVSPSDCSSQRQAHSRTQTGPSTATGRDEFSGALFPCRSWRHVHHHGITGRSSRSSRHPCREMPLCSVRYELSKLRAKAWLRSSHILAISSPAKRLSYLSAVSQAV